jgi:CRISPR-associated protein Csm1
MARRRGAPASGCDAAFFSPGGAAAPSESDDYFTEELGREFVDADLIGWSPEEPARLSLGVGKHVWSLRSNTGEDSLPVARHTVPSDDGAGRAGAAMLASRAEGRTSWAILRGDVDNLGIRLRRAQSIEEHVQLSVMYKNFFAGELEVLCSLPEFWRKVNILYCGGDDFAVYGAWDALIQLARELRRLFHRFSDENLKDFPGPDGKTLTMALAVAGRPDASFTAVYQQAGEQLEAAKSADKDCFSLFGRILEWKQVTEASDLKDALARMVREFGCPRQFLQELANLTRPETAVRGRLDRFDRPWRLNRRLNRLSAGVREREFQKLRARVATEMLGKSAAHVKLRPAGSVAVGWARLLTEV